MRIRKTAARETALRLPVGLVLMRNRDATDPTGSARQSPRSHNMAIPDCRRLTRCPFPAPSIL